MVPVFKAQWTRSVASMYAGAEAKWKKLGSLLEFVPPVKKFVNFTNTTKTHWPPLVLIPQHCHFR